MPTVNENNCGVKVYFPLTLTCQGTNPTSVGGSNGSISLLVNGGTPPYDISWSNNNYGTTITNLTAGNYTATVVDYYGTSAKTTCNLSNPISPTPTPTPTPTPILPTTYNLCMTIITNGGGISQTQYVPNGTYNGKPSWISNESTTKIIWNTGLNYWSVSGTSSTIISSTTASPPINGWQKYGNPPSTVSVIVGTCTTPAVSNFTYSLTQPTCSNDGAITIIANGSNPPFQYSINGGLNYFPSPNFNNLGGGTYSIFVKDSLNNTSSNVVTLNSATPTAQYTLNVTRTINAGITTVNFTVSPALPNGVTLKFNTTYTNIFTRTPQSTTATENYGITAQKNNSTVISPSTTNTNNTTTPNTSSVTCTAYTNYITSTVNGWNTVSLTTGDTFKLTSSSVININGCTGPGTPICCSANSSSNITVSNVSVTGCNCCTVTINKNF
jgi:hypothetical protein